MDSTLYLQRAENEIELAKIIFRITTEPHLQENIFSIEQPLTFFSAVISHSYYCIFYSAKAYLLKKGIITHPPEEHKKTYAEFKKLVEEGIIDVELFKLYDKVIVKANTLLEFFKTERRKRGKFTYQELPLANKEPAQKSLIHAQTFFRHIYNL